MHRGRILFVTTLAALSIVVAGCGVEAGDQASSTTSDTSTTSASDPGSSDPGSSGPSTSGELTPEQQAAADTVAKTYEDLGLSKKDARCLADALVGGMSDGSNPMDSSSVMDAVNECDISMDELMEMGPGPGASAEDSMKFGLEASLKNAGLTDEQASCVADAFVDKYGSDVTAAQDEAKIRPLMKKCDVDPNDFDLGN